MDYKVVKSPNIIISNKNGDTLVKNHFNRNSVLFKGKDIVFIIELFEEPQYIEYVSSALIDKIPDIRETIKSLIEWDFLIIDLQLNKRSCPLCGDKNNTIIVEHNNDYYKTTFQYVRCSKCDLVYLNPAPPEDVLNFFYSFKNYYSTIPIHSSNKYEKKLQLISNRLRVELLESYFSLNNKTNVLDVGSGTGIFASFLSQEYNSNVTCVDKDPEALKFISKNYPQITCLKHDFKNTNLSSQYDVITMWGFIEHEYQPVETLKKAWKLLKPGGYIIIDAPNIRGKLAHKSLTNWPYLHSPYHLCHYEPKTIKKLVLDTGFQVVDLKFKKTGAFLLKYSDIVLSFIYKYKLFYSSTFIDYVFFILSKIFKKGEHNSDSRIIIIGKK